ncbi:MAG TPA: hypothetical protein PLW83_05100 [Deltaproteobacteria bacterium]|nr:hypothetical protein [Deltaproteobacteria bacterium]
MGIEHPETVTRKKGLVEGHETTRGVKGLGMLVAREYGKTAARFWK